MPLNAFIIRPFGRKDVLLPGKTEVMDGDAVRVSKLIQVDFEQVHAELIAPALQSLNIAANTTEVIVEAGNIREDMFNLLMTADLVVADVTIHNPNVFYELGIRHAFRDRYTFLMRSDGNDDPFDLKTDRYFKYDHQHPAESIEALTKALRATIASERSDSPVFRLLPKMRAEDRSRFISVPTDFLEAVERAKKYHRCGDLQLLAVECEGFLWEVEGLREVGRAQFQLNFMYGAQNTWEEIVRRYPNDVEANMVLSTIYQRANDGTRSEQALARISKLDIPDINTVAEIQALVGRNLKSRWMDGWYPQLRALRRRDLKGNDRNIKEAMDRQRERALRSPLLRKAREAYALAYRDNLNYTYAGLNALSLMIIEVSLAREFPETWKLLVQEEEDPQQKLLEICSQIEKLTAALDFAISSGRKSLMQENRVDFWFEAMEAAFFCVSSECKEKVAQEYLEAMLWAPARAEESMRPALSMYLDLKTRHPNPAIDIPGNVEAALELINEVQEDQRRGTILVFVGLRLEEGGQDLTGAPRRTAASDIMRFLPQDQLERARSAVREAIEAERKANGPILFGMASGANGCDLIFHSVCDELEIATQLYLALPRDRYVGKYVAPAGAQWIDRFNRIYRDRAGNTGGAGPGKIESGLAVNVLSDSIEMPRWLQGKPGYTIGKRNSVWMLQHALAQRHLCGSDRTNVTMIALWDRKDMRASCGIGELVQLAEKSGVKVIHLNCADWSTREAGAISLRKAGHCPQPLPLPKSRRAAANLAEKSVKAAKDRSEGEPLYANAESGLMLPKKPGNGESPKAEKT